MKTIDDVEVPGSCPECPVYKNPCYALLNWRIAPEKCKELIYKHEKGLLHSS